MCGKKKLSYISKKLKISFLVFSLNKSVGFKEKLKKKVFSVLKIIY